MAVLRRRSKMVSFRLSEQEYEGLISLCTTRGARSLSDLARDAMCRLLDAGNGSGDGVETEIERLHGRMEELDREVRRLAELVGGSQ